jgi:GNAT superfamily N-acetyltransferase
MRRYRDEEDYWGIREFLRGVFLLNDRRERSWPVARLDYWRWHVVENCQICDPVEQVTFLWEAEEGELVAVLNPEGRSEAWLQVHPGPRTAGLEEEMLDTAEEHLASTSPEGGRKLTVWASEHDHMRQQILSRRGYLKGEWPDHKHTRSLDVPIPPAPPPQGYTVRSLGTEEELPARSWLSWLAFHPNEPDENYQGWEWYHNIQRMPQYRRDLDIVAVAPDGELAAFCTLWYDEVTRSGYFEPVGTAPAHQRKGLGKAVMCEALRRLQRMGGTQATVGGFTKAANALYGSVMGTDVELIERWIREW